MEDSCLLKGEPVRVPGIDVQLSKSLCDDGVDSEDLKGGEPELLLGTDRLGGYEAISGP